MDRKALSIFCFVLLVAFGQSTPVPKTAFARKVDNFVVWTNQARGLLDNELTTANLATSSRNMGRAMNELMAELMRSGLGSRINQAALSNRVRNVIHQATNAANIRGDNIRPLQLPATVTSSQRARIAVAARVFDQMGLRLQTQVELLQGVDLLPADAETILENVFATTTSFRKLVSSIREAEVHNMRRLHQQRASPP